jgi:hypothetical protein
MEKMIADIIRAQAESMIMAKMADDVKKACKKIEKLRAMSDREILEQFNQSL